MAIAVEMPKMSDTMVEGVLVEWSVNEGDKVSSGDIIAQVETDKATMDLEAYDDGVLLKQVASEGDAIEIGGLIAILGKAGEDVSEILAKYAGGVPAKQTVSESKDVSESSAESSPVSEASSSSAEPVASSNGRIKVSPLARKMAADKGLSLSSISGSGPDGRIVRRDVEGASPASSSTSTAPVTSSQALVRMSGGVQDVALTQMRKTIARRLAESKFGAPHFYLSMDVDMAQTVEMRGRINEEGARRGLPKISFNDIIVKACAHALRIHPEVNSSYLETEGVIRQYEDIHVAVAVAVAEGLVTPVVRHTDRIGLAEIAGTINDLASRAKTKKLGLDEMQGSTFTTSNLGMFGIREFTAIINPPNACILAIGAVRDEAVVRGGQVVAGKTMTVTLSCDHRVVDGAVGSAFLVTLKGLLEDPARMLI